MAQRRPAWATPALLLAVLAIGGYLGFRAYGKGAALDLVRESGLSGQMTAVPHGPSPFLWDVIVQVDGYTASVVDVGRRRVLESKVIPSADDAPEAALSKRSPLVQAFLHRARFPVVTVTRVECASLVEWRDVHLMIGGGVVRGVSVVLNEIGETGDERFDLEWR